MEDANEFIESIRDDCECRETGTTVGRGGEEAARGILQRECARGASRVGCNDARYRGDDGETEISSHRPTRVCPVSRGGRCNGFRDTREEAVARIVTLESPSNVARFIGIASCKRDFRNSLNTLFYCDECLQRASIYRNDPQDFNNLETVQKKFRI